MAGRPLGLIAAGTGAATALLGMVAAVAVVAACWLPVSGTAGNASSAIRAGVLTFVTALHPGVTLDGVPTAFVPLGMTLLVLGLACRAGRGLADVAAAPSLQATQPQATQPQAAQPQAAQPQATSLQAAQPQATQPQATQPQATQPRAPQPLTARQLAAAGTAQAAAFAVVCGAAARFGTLGTTSVPAPAAAAGGFVLFAVGGGVAFVRSSLLAGALSAALPNRVRRAAGRVVRAAAIALAVQAAGAAVLVAGALAVHHGNVAELSRQVGGGWSGLPVLLLCLLAVPNAMVAGSSYLAGPGFALGTGDHVSLLTTAHGTLPAFPLLGAVPIGHGGTWPVWVLAGSTPLIAGTLAALTVRSAGSLGARLRDGLVAALLAGCAATVLGWQAGGAIGSGRLSAIGPSAWQFGLATAGQLAVVTALATALGAAVSALRPSRSTDAADPPTATRATLTALALVIRDHRPSAVDARAADADADTEGEDELAG